jgi:hypothetical protein
MMAIMMTDNKVDEFVELAQQEMAVMDSAEKRFLETQLPDIVVDFEASNDDTLLMVMV